MNLLAVITGNDSVQALIGSLFSNYTNIYFPLRGKHTVDTFTQNCISICNHMPRRKIRHLQFCCNARQSLPTASLCRRLTARFAPKSFLDQNSSTARFTPLYVDSLYLKYTMQSCLKVGCLKLSKICNFWPKMFSKDTHTGRLNHSNPIPPCRFGEHHQQPRK